MNRELENLRLEKARETSSLKNKIAELQEEMNNVQKTCEVHVIELKAEKELLHHELEKMRVEMRYKYFHNLPVDIHLIFCD